MALRILAIGLSNVGKKRPVLNKKINKISAANFGTV
jgi:hypothetical protein